MQTVSIVPAVKGWIVRADGLDSEQFVLKGSAAETTALKMATALAQSDPVEVIIWLRDGSVASRFVVPPAGQAPPRNGEEAA